MTNTSGITERKKAAKRQRVYRGVVRKRDSVSVSKVTQGMIPVVIVKLMSYFRYYANVTHRAVNRVCDYGCLRVFGRQSRARLSSCFVMMESPRRRSVVVELKEFVIDNRDGTHIQPPFRCWCVPYSGCEKNSNLKADASDTEG